MGKWYLHACPVCGSDLQDDIEEPGWVICFLCARTFPRQEILPTPDRLPDPNAVNYVRPRDLR